jgi:hypothetical protein
MKTKNNSITLLDGSVWQRDALIEKMADDDFYYGYMGMSSLSSSAVKMLADSPKVYHYYLNGSKIKSPAIDIGKITHAMILEPHKVVEMYEVIDVSSRSTKAFKEAEMNASRILLTEAESVQIDKMVTAIRKNIEISQIIDESNHEVPNVGLIDGLAFRAKADIITHNGIIYDIKTTSDLKSFRKSAFLYGYNAQAAIYCNLFGVPYTDFRYIVIDKGSYDLGIINISEEFYLSGVEMMEKAIQTYVEYFVEGKDIYSFLYKQTL